jgi:hypothetical protein
MAPQLLPLIYRTLGHTAGLVGVAGGVAVVDFTDKITLGSIITTVVLVIIAGVFTLRAKIATIWREEAEGERAAKERCHEELLEERSNRLEFDRQQQELRHDLKGEIATLQAQLHVMETKTDLTSALAAIEQMNQAAVSSVSNAIADALGRAALLSESRDIQTHRLLEEIRDKLPDEPIAVHDVNLDE